MPDIKGRDFIIRGSKTVEERFIGNANMFSVKDREKLLKTHLTHKSPQEIVASTYKKVTHLNASSSNSLPFFSMGRRRPEASGSPSSISMQVFDEVVGATFDGRIDTKEEVLNEVMRRWSDIPRDEMCLIGDTMFDIEGANRVNVPSIAVSFGFGDVNEMVSAGAKAVIDDIRQLPDVLSRLFD